jgi:hypothetical protein
MKSPVKHRVLNNNFRGRPVDKMTAEQMSPDSKAFRSIYGGDFEHKNPQVEEERYRSPENIKSHRELELTVSNQPSIQEDIPRVNLLSPDMKSTVSRSEFFTTHGHRIHAPDRDPHKTFSDIPYLDGEEAKHYEDMRNLVYHLKYKGPKGTLYQRDYVEHPLNQQGPVWKNDFYTTFQNNNSLSYGTTSKADFKAWSVGPVKKETMNWRPATTGIPFGGRTSYKVDFIDYGSNFAAFAKRKELPTTIAELPLFAKSTYKEDFGKNNQETPKKAKPADNNLFGKRSPLSTAIPFLGESMAMKSFKPFKVMPAPPQEKYAEPYEPSKSYEGSFKSTYRSDFKKADSKNPKEFMIPKFSFI